MRYLGGKHKSSKYILPILNDFVIGCDYYEPFCGAVNIGSGIRCASSVTLSDAHPDLVALLQAAQAGWVPDRLVVDESEYAALKACSEPSAWRGLVGFGQSYGGKWFGGYARVTPPRVEDFLGGQLAATREENQQSTAEHDHSASKLPRLRAFRPPERRVLPRPAVCWHHRLRGNGQV